MLKKMELELSGSEEGGVLYAYTDGDGTIKVGRTNCLQRRMEEWDKGCPNPNRIWLGFVETNYSHRLGKLFSWGETGIKNDSEALVHLRLKIVGLRRDPMYCLNCSRNHVEKFDAPGGADLVWREIVKPIAEELARFLEALYD